MAEFNQVTYTSQGTEIEFITGFTNLILGLWQGATLEDANGDEITLSDLYVDTTSTVQFYINFGGYRLEVHRGNAISSNTSVFVFMGRNCTFGNSSAYDAQTTRTFNITYFKTADFLCLFIGGVNSSVYQSACYTISFRRSGIIYTAALAGSDITGARFYGSDSSSVYLAKVFTYTQGAGMLDYTTKTPLCYTGATGAKAFDTEDICSCNITTLGTSFALPNGKNYFAIGTNWMVEVDPTS